MLMILDIAILVNSKKVIIISNQPGLSGCAPASKNSEGKSLYSHSEVFAGTAKPKNVEVFKYHCTINLTLSTVNDLVS